jgi:hypothetical protein
MMIKFVITKVNIDDMGPVHFEAILTPMGKNHTREKCFYKLRNYFYSGKLLLIDDTFQELPKKEKTTVTLIGYPPGKSKAKKFNFDLKPIAPIKKGRKKCQ